jgi:hypothetical protein
MLLILPIHGTCAKSERGYCYLGRAKKKPLSVFKMSAGFPRIHLRRRLVKNVFGSGFQRGESGFRRGGRVVSGIRGRGGGGGVRNHVVKTCGRGGFTFRTPPWLNDVGGGGGPEYETGEWGFILRI